MPTVTPLDSSFGAVITDIKLGAMSDADWKVVEDAFHEYAALVFPGQHLTNEEHVAFGERFGAIEILRNDGNKFAMISNKAADGHVLTAEEKRFQTLRGNEGWHTDSSYMPLAAKASILTAITVPKAGGQTELADMRDAYDKLSDAMKAKIENLVAYHSLYASQAKAGYVFKTGESYGFHNHGAPIRPLVKVHPVTGRKSLFIGRHAYRIPGMDDAAAQKLLDELLAFAVQPSRTYSHQWQPGDVMMWDNRCVLHRACPYDYSEPRVMRHVRIAGEPVHDRVETAPDERADAFEPVAAE
ncbi:MAG: TauD/TfdA family dioxygenase [Alphaproteobacteria bacterium]|nr:TauD/TfdA family dioxygenase [Alphaproteobacteria bacterium]MCB9931305.1 TauD/TfdA family dioxygenase [Alphaproteobacteria bacterium]